MCNYIVPVAMDIAANAPQIIKAILLRIFANMIGAKHEAANLNDPWIIAWCSGGIGVFVCADANCKKKNCLWQYVKQETKNRYY